MGLLDNLFNTAPQLDETVDAALAPVNTDTYGYVPITSVSRDLAMTVPAVKRAMGIFSGTIGSLPIEQYNKATGAHVVPPRSITQPDPRVPASFVYAWLALDIKLYGVGYVYIMSTYADGKYQDWTRVAPERVTPQFNNNSTEVVGYLLDGNPVPNFGVGSIQAFYGLEDGLLTCGARTIRAAIALEDAAKSFAEYPTPQMVLKSTGTNLTKERISKLLDAWNANRYKKNATAYLNADVDLKEVGLDPARMQLNDARQYVALEIARLAGIPAFFLSAEPNSMTYSNAINERKALVDFGLRPVMTAIEQRLSMPDFSSSLVETRFDLDDFLRGNPLERAQVYEILNRIGAMSVEQIQQEEDLIR